MNWHFSTLMISFFWQVYHTEGYALYISSIPFRIDRRHQTSSFQIFENARKAWWKLNTAKELIPEGGEKYPLLDSGGERCERVNFFWFYLAMVEVDWAEYHSTSLSAHVYGLETSYFVLFLKCC